MKIGMLTTSYPRSEADVAGDFVRGYARTLASLGHSIDVLAPEPREREAPLLDPAITVHQVPYLRPRALARTFYGAGVPDNLRRDPLAWPGALTYPLALAVRTAMHDTSWDAYVSHWALPSALVAGARCGDRPHVAVMHSADVHLLTRLPGGCALAARIDRGATRLVFVSDDLRARFATVLGREPHTRTEVAPMGFEPVVLRPEGRASVRARLGVSGTVVLTMGRLVTIKGVDDLLRAMRAVGGTTLVVAGDGPERARLEAEAAALGVDARFVGVVRDDAKSDWLHAADLFVLASKRLADGRTEGSPVSLLEAMHAGLPVVATDTGGVREALGAAGELVPGGDARALAAAITRLVADPALRLALGHEGRRRAAAQTWASRARWFESLFERSRPELRSAPRDDEAA